MPTNWQLPKRDISTKNSAYWSTRRLGGAATGMWFPVKPTPSAALINTISFAETGEGTVGLVKKTELFDLPVNSPILTQTDSF